MIEAILDVVRKVEGGWAVFSKEGKRLSKVYKTKREAIKRLMQIEMFKHKDK
mgnify:CR=1 FL=1